ncbi:MAG: FHA domain-containing protein [Thermoflexales bacterium]|nr:FHA domain-containing protein [Thermoflexales bacterium]
MKKQISQFEALAERLVEGTFSRLFAGRLHPLEVATALARATEDAQVVNRHGERLAPNVYWVYLSPEDYEALQASHPTLPDDLAQSVAQLGSQAGLLVAQTPVVEVHYSEKIPRRRASVVARYIPPEDGMGGTTDQLDVTLQTAATRQPSARSFLILYGTRTVLLGTPIVSLGRSFENDVVIDDSRVSRRHAQLRQRAGRYVIYDLGSSGGTLVNGVRVSECILSSGDVISLAGLEIVYGEEDLSLPPSPALQDTPVMGGHDA